MNVCAPWHAVPLARPRRSQQGSNRSGESLESVTISGNTAEGVLVDPTPGCTVCPYDRKSLAMGGSTISGNGADGVNVTKGDVKIVKDSTVSENAGNGILTTLGGANLLRVDLLDNGGDGLDAPHGRCKDCQVLRNALNGINFHATYWDFARKLVKRSTLSENGMNGVTGVERVLRSTVNDNTLAGVESSARVKDVQALRNGTWGVSAGVAVRLEARENGIAGIWAGQPVRLTRSVLTGNGTSPDCGSTSLCADYLIETYSWITYTWELFPCDVLGWVVDWFRDTQCGTSFGCVDAQEQTHSLGVCEFDIGQLVSRR